MRKPLSTESATSLRGMFEEASRAVGFEEHRTPGVELPRMIQRPAVVTRFLDMSEITLPPLPVADGEINLSPATSAHSIKLDAALIAQSRVAQAGARIHIARERPKVAPEVDELAVYRDIGQLRRIMPAEFATLADGANVGESALPVLSDTITWNGAGAPNVSFRTRVTRRQQKDVGGQNIEELLLHSIVLGLAREADKTLLSAILATNPAAFTIGAAAARKLAFTELRGIVGSSGNGAFVSAAGDFVCANFNTSGWAGGVRAELTDVIAPTVVGAFGFAGVAVRPELMVHIERRDTSGDLVLTCHAAMLPMLPDAASFWLVS